MSAVTSDRVRSRGVIASIEPLERWDEEVEHEELTGEVNVPGQSGPIGSPAGDGGCSTSGMHGATCT